MSGRRWIPVAALVLAAMALLSPGSAKAQQQGKSTSPAATAAASQTDDAALRIEGEKRFHANCGRCHQAPHKFPPRMMATIVRHMRVRATLTDEDMRAILAYMTQ